MVHLYNIISQDDATSSTNFKLLSYLYTILTHDKQNKKYDLVHLSPRFQIKYGRIKYMF